MSTRRITIPTNKASGLTARMNITTAERHAGKADEHGLWYYYELTREMMRLGVSTDSFVKAYKAHPKRRTRTGAGLGNYLGAIKRAVNKYGSVEKVDKAFTNWCRENRERKGGIADFIEWAPAGQRAKNGKKAVTPAGVVTLTTNEASSRLRKSPDVPNALIKDIVKALGLR